MSHRNTLLKSHYNPLFETNFGSKFESGRKLTPKWAKNVLILQSVFIKSLILTLENFLSKFLDYYLMTQNVISRGYYISDIRISINILSNQYNKNVKFKDYSNTTKRCLFSGDSLQCTPLDRAYKSKVLGHYPDSVPWNPFDEHAVCMVWTFIIA